jgi:hypothetical protein
MGSYPEVRSTRSDLGEFPLEGNHLPEETYA